MADSKMRIVDDLVKFIGTLPYAAEVNEFTPLIPHGFNANIRCDFQVDCGKGVSYESLATEFVKCFGKATHLDWIRQHTFSEKAGKKEKSRLDLSYKFWCHLSSLNKRERKPNPRTGCSRQNNRNFECKAWITVKVHRLPLSLTRQNICKDEFLKRENPLNADVKIHFEHTHGIYNESVLPLLRASSGDKAAMTEMFKQNQSYPADVHELLRNELLETGVGQEEVVHITSSRCDNEVDVMGEEPLPAQPIPPPPDRSLLIKSAVDEFNNVCETWFDNNDSNAVIQLTKFVKSMRDIKSPGSFTNKLAQLNMAKKDLIARKNLKRRPPASSRNGIHCKSRKRSKL